MTDPTFNNLGNLIFEEFNALCPQGEHAPGPEPLSPAAQALLDAVFDHWPGGYDHPGKPRCVAAALRALADQLRLELPLGDTDADAGVFATHQAIYRYLRDIATELEGHG